MTVVPARVAGVARDRRRLAGRPGRRRRPGPARRRRACSRSTRSSSPAAPRRSARSRSGWRDDGAGASSRSTGSSAPATPGSPPRSSRSPGSSASTCPAGPSEGMVLADGDRRPGARRRRPRHPGRARPRLAGDPRDDDAAPRRRRRARDRRRSCRASSGATSSPAPSRATAGSSSRRTSDAAIAFVDAYAPEHLSIDVRDADAVAGADPPRRLDLRRAAGRRSPPATTRPARTTSCRPAASPGSCDPLGGRGVRPVQPDPAGRRARPRGDPRDGRPARDGRGADGPPERRRGPLRAATAATEPAAMSPTPGHRTACRPSRPATAGRRPTRRSRRATASRSTQILRFDLNTSPAPPELAAALLAAGTFEAPLSEYPPSDYRRLVETAAARLRRRDRRAPRRGRARTRSSTSSARRSCRPAAAAVVPTPTYAMYRVVTEQRGAAVVAVPRLRPRRGLRAWISPRSARPRADAADRLALQPEQPDRPAGAARRDRGAARRDRRRRRGRRSRARRSSCSTRPTPSSSDASLLELRHDHPNLVVVRTASKAYALAGPAGRVRDRPARDDRPDRAVPAAGIGRRRSSVTIVTAALDDPRGAWPRTSPASTPSATGSPAASRPPAGRSGRRSRTSCSSTSGRPSARPPRRRRSCDAASCRGRSRAGHPARPLPAADGPRPGRATTG